MTENTDQGKALPITPSEDVPQPDILFSIGIGFVKTKQIEKPIKDLPKTLDISAKD